MRQLSYDESQMDTELRVCPTCERPYYMRPWRRICIGCSGAIPTVAEPSCDVSGNPMIFGP